MLAGEDSLISEVLMEQYDLLYGHWPESEEEVVLIVNGRNELSDLALYALGFKDNEKLAELMEAAMRGQQIEEVGQESWSFEEVCAKEFKIILPVEQYQAKGDGYVHLTETDLGMDYLYHNDEVGIPVRISGIIRMSEDASAGMLTGSIGYTSALTKRVMEEVAESELYQAQMADESVDVFTGLPFRTEDYTEPADAEKAAAITDWLAEQETEVRAEAYAFLAKLPDEAMLQGMVQQQMAGLTREQIEEQVVAQYAGSMDVDPEVVMGYIAAMSDEELFASVGEAMYQGAVEQYAAEVELKLAEVPVEQQSMLLDTMEWTEPQLVQLYDEMMPPVVSDATLDENYERMGYACIEEPSGVNLYAATFSDKDEIAEVIADYNASVAEEDQISYTDYVALLMSSITGIISGISYLLIAFVGISLVVSSIMIGIITHISVLERTREIGILRAIGASKKDIAHVFNAETLLVGLCAGIIGILVSVLLNFPINAILHALTDLTELKSQLPWAGGVILVVISTLLTYIAGLVPSRAAARKDPVEALRTE